MTSRYGRDSGGRFELGLGAGAFWEAIGAMGGPVRSGREALQALEEAIRIARAFWGGERTTATAAGRDPSEIRRLYNVGGVIGDGPTRGLLQGPPEHWVETRSGFADELGFDTFVFWPDENPLVQVERFATEVVPALRN